VGDGSTTFDLPPSLGRTVINVDGAANRITSASTNGANADTLGGVGGAETHTLGISELASHAHTQTGVNASNGASNMARLTAAAGSTIFHQTVGGTTASATAAVITVSTGGGGAHSNTQPWIAKKKFIRF